MRFICGTQEIHRRAGGADRRVPGTEDAILFGSCFDANAGLFEMLLTTDDAVISDELNHATIIDGIRLGKAQRLRYRNSDMADLEAKLQEASGARRRLIATDGVFSMDGYIANLPAICDLAERYDAMVMVDDSHAVGFLGPAAAGTPESTGVGRPRGHPHRHAGQGDRRRQRRVRRQPRARSSSCCASARGRTCSRTPSPRRSSAPRWRRSTCSSRSGERRERLRREHGWFRRAARPGRASRCCPASTRSCR